MMKNKHFRKDVVMARIIAAILLIVLIALIVVAVQFFTKSKDKNEDSQNSQDTQGSYIQSEEISDSEEETEEIPESESESETEADIDMNEDLYVKTTTQVKLRQEPNTNCATLDRIDGGTKLKVIESMQEWYKVNHNGQIGYVNANYAEIVEE